MLMTIRYQSGLRVEAVLLAANRERMRGAVDSQRDTIELHKVDARWFTQEGAEIEIEAFIPLSGSAVSHFCAAVYPRCGGMRFHGCLIATGSFSCGFSSAVSEGRQGRGDMRDRAVVVAWVRELLNEDPFPPRVVQALAALAAFAARFPFFTRRLGSMLHATANPDPGRIAVSWHQCTN